MYVFFSIILWKICNIWDTCFIVIFAIVLDTKTRWIVVN